MNPVIEVRIPHSAYAACRDEDDVAELIAQSIKDAGGDWTKPPLGPAMIDGDEWVYRVTPLLTWLPQLGQNQ